MSEEAGRDAVDRPALSVIIATRNRAGVLSECLESLAAQLETKPVEVVIVDNASDDGTAALCDEWRRRDPRFRYVREDSVGLSAAKNRGIAAARGGVLVFTDDDVVLDPRWIDAYMDFFSRRGGTLLAGGPVLPIPEDRDWPSWLSDGSTIGLPVLDHGKERSLEPHEYIWGANLAAPADTIAKLGGFDESVGRRGDERGTYEDVDVVERARSRGYAIWFCPGARIFHRIGTDRLTPRKILGAAFAAGTMDRWRRHRAQGGGRSATARARLAHAVLLGLRSSLWIAWSVAFRIRPNALAFDRARRAAWRAGWSLQAVTGPPDADTASSARRAAFLVRRVALAITPDLRR